MSALLVSTPQMAHDEHREFKTRLLCSGSQTPQFHRVLEWLTVQGGEKCHVCQEFKQETEKSTCFGTPNSTGCDHESVLKFNAKFKFIRPLSSFQNINYAVSCCAFPKHNTSYNTAPTGLQQGEATICEAGNCVSTGMFGCKLGIHNTLNFFGDH